MRGFFRVFSGGRAIVFSSDGHRLDTTAMLAPFLRRAGCRNIQTRAYAIEVVVRGRGL